MKLSTKLQICGSTLFVWLRDEWLICRTFAFYRILSFFEFWSKQYINLSHTSITLILLNKQFYFFYFIFVSTFFVWKIIPYVDANKPQKEDNFHFIKHSTTLVLPTIFHKITYKGWKHNWYVIYWEKIIIKCCVAFNC